MLDDASFPIVGEGDAQPNDTFREQLVANAKAAIDAGLLKDEIIASLMHPPHSFMNRLFEENSGSQVRLTCNFRNPASSPGVGM